MPESIGRRVPQAALAGLMAEFSSVESLKDAVKMARAAGYGMLETYSPYPVPEVVEELGFKSRAVSVLTLLGAILGASSAYFMEWYAFVVDYPLNVGGRPYHSAPAFIPVTIELGMLGGALAATFGMLFLNRLPCPYHPNFNVPAFARASRDAFFLCIDAADPRFDQQRTKDFLLDLGPRGVHDIPS